MATRISRQIKFLIAAVALMSAACTMSSTDIPALTGPSELALSLGLTAAPDTITQNGLSQSLITLTARDINGSAMPGQVFRVDSFPLSYGSLSGRTVVTASDGKALVVYTAPPAPPNGAVVGACRGLPGICVTIVATPISTGFFSGTNSQSVDIHLIPVDIIFVPGAPLPDFVYSPTSPKINTEILFNAGASVAASGRVLVSYTWDWGDGTKGNGVTEDHDYIAPGPYFVSLTVTDDIGAKASATKTITVVP